MLPDMSDVLIEWETSVTIKTVTETTVNFNPVNTVKGRTQLCVIQVADKEKINPQTIDWSLEYIMIHSRSAIQMGELVFYKGVDFKVISRGPWTSYGYTEVIAAETKRTIVAVTA